MQKRVVLIGLLLLATLMMSAAENDLSELRALAMADPAKDFEAARSKNDIHFIGVNGITLMVPGVDRGSEHYRRIETRVVKGTSDVAMNDEQIPLTLKVLAYAEKYNALVLQFLSEREKAH